MNKRSPKEQFLSQISLWAVDIVFYRFIVK